MTIDLDYIEHLAENHEGVDVEFKETTGQLNRGMETLCGMFNGSGGVVVFGVSNKGKIIGQEIGDKTTREIGEAINKFDPAVDIQPIYVPVDNSDKYAIVFRTDGLESDKPYMWDGKPYRRHDSVTSVMPREKFIRLHELQHGLKYKWENEVNQNLTIDDLDEQLIHNVIQGAVRRGRLSNDALNDTVPIALSRLNLTKDGAVCNSAAVLFGKVFSDYPQCRLRLARFKGASKQYFIDNQQHEGNIFELVDAAMAFFFKHLNLSGKITNHSLQREERLEVPYHALREALINSLCHRQWEKHNLTGSIAIYDDRIEIANPGIFPPQISPESIKEPHESYPYNLKIAEALYKSTYLESWGSGAKRIMDACREQGVEEPTWRWDGGFVIVTFKRPRKAFPVQGANTQPVSSKQHTTTIPVLHQFHTSSIPVQTLIENGTDEFMTALELANLCGLKNIRHFRKFYLNPALADGAIERLYPDTPNHPQQKYRLTEAAKEWKNNKIPKKPKNSPKK